MTEPKDIPFFGSMDSEGKICVTLASWKMLFKKWGEVEKMTICEKCKKHLYKKNIYIRTSTVRSPNGKQFENIVSFSHVCPDCFPFPKTEVLDKK